MYFSLVTFGSISDESDGQNRAILDHQIDA
jgi:hypothetical protein